METKRVIWVMWVMVCGCFISQTSWAKSVFAVASHGNGRIKAYKIESDYVYYQDTVSNTENFGNGATGLCVWPEFEKIFVCYEGSNKIAWASCKTLTRQSNDEYDAPQNDLAGMAIDQTRQVMYVVSRSGGHLYAFYYDPIDDTLILYPPDNSSLSYRQLVGLESGTCFGIAFQTGSLLGGDYLYVANGTNIVRCYNTETWQLVRQLDMKKEVIGLDVDEQRGTVYGGGHWNNNYLVRYNLNGDPISPSTCSYVDLGFGVTDVKIDEDTGYLYMLTRRSDLGGLGSFEMYDPTQWTTDPNDLIHKDTEFDADYSGEGPGGLGIGPTYKSPRGFVGKVDDVDESSSYVLPDDVFHYYITYHPGQQNETNVAVTDFLPDGVDLISANPNWGTYYPRPEHKYVWQLGNVPGWTPDPNDPTDPNYYFSLTVRVNTLAEPATDLENRVEVEADEALTKAQEQTPVGWFGGNIIYVKWDAAGADIGTDWTNAYKSLTKALGRAALAPDPNAVEVRVARGTYKPGSDVTATFRIPAGIEVYGGWLGNPANPTERNIKQYETILSGLINDTQRNITVVTMGALTLLEGVTVTESGGTPASPGRGIYGTNVDFTISNCFVKYNQRFGIRAENSNATIKWCVVSGNGYDGIRHVGNNSKSLTVENTRIFENGQNGLYAGFSSMTIINSAISFNGSDNTGEYYGIYNIQPFTSSTIKNCSVVCNANKGLYFTGFGTKYPLIRNCILWGNNHNGLQLDGYRTAYYSCIYDPNHPNQTTPDATYHNISCNPCYAYNGDPNVPVDHLLSNSPCIDKGDPYLSYSNQADIDEETRVMGNYVELGADEVDPQCGEIYNALDWNWDGLVNLDEFNVFSQAWKSHNPIDPALTDPNYPMYPYYHDPNSPYYVGNSALVNWNPQCNLSIAGLSEFAIDLADLTVWIDNSPWLWVACWRTDIQEMQQQMMIMQSMVAPDVSEGIVPSEAMMTECGTATLGCDASSISLPIMEEEQAAPSTETNEEFDPVVEYVTILSLLDDIDGFIDAGGEDAKTWAEMKDILEQSLADMEVMTNDPNEI